MNATKLAVFLSLVGSWAGLTAAQPRFETIYQFGASTNAGNVPTPTPAGNLYGIDGPGLWELTPPSGGGPWNYKRLLFAHLGSPFTVGPSGELYYAGGCNCQYGGISLLTPPSTPSGHWTESTLYTFTNTPDGAYPEGPLILNPDGSLYGATGQGGQFGYGTVFQLIPPAAPGAPWTETILYSFAGAPNDAGYPGIMAEASDGSLYGTASGGPFACPDSRACGTVFHLTPPSAPGAPWQESVLYNFQSFSDGYNPGYLVWAPTGELYGTTGDGGSGGSYGGGTVFSLSPPSAPGGPWTKTTIHKFLRNTGVGPTGLAMGMDGNLYGTTLTGGAECNKTKRTCGVVFELLAPATPGGAWKDRVVHYFLGKTSEDGAQPEGGLSVGPDGTIYGTTFEGGKGNGGTVFQVKP